MEQRNCSERGCPYPAIDAHGVCRYHCRENEALESWPEMNSGHLFQISLTCSVAMCLAVSRFKQGWNCTVKAYSTGTVRVCVCGVEAIEIATAKRASRVATTSIKP